MVQQESLDLTVTQVGRVTKGRGVYLVKRDHKAPLEDQDLQDHTDQQVKKEIKEIMAIQDYQGRMVKQDIRGLRDHLAPLGDPALQEKRVMSANMD